MGISIAWPWKKDSTTKKGHKTINAFFGFFFLVNYCVGTGFLGVPYAFFSSGYLAAIPTLLFISVINWVNANYLLEVMARAQVRNVIILFIASYYTMNYGTANCSPTLT